MERRFPSTGNPRGPGGNGGVLDFLISHDTAIIATDIVAITLTTVSSKIMLNILEITFDITAPGKGLKLHKDSEYFATN